MRNSIYLSLISLIVVIACNNNQQEQSIVPTILLENDSHVVSWTHQDSVISFQIDAIGDTTNDISKNFPFGDIYWIFFDMNNNGMLDSNVDKMYSPVGDYICEAFLVQLPETELSLESRFAQQIGKQVTTKCDINSGAKGEARFSATSAEETLHTNYTLNIPVIHFSQNEIGVIIEFKDGVGEKISYPEHKYPFSSTLKLDLGTAVD